jgi:hypothetical protein
MKLEQADILLDKYFKGETTLVEEKQLKLYFSSQKVADKHKKYEDLFRFLKQELEADNDKQSLLKPRTSRLYTMAVAAAVVGIIFSISYYYLKQQTVEDLGTFDDPEIAFRETQKALNLLSAKLNKGIESVEYLSEYEKSRKIVFKN